MEPIPSTSMISSLPFIGAVRSGKGSNTEWEAPLFFSQFFGYICGTSRKCSGGHGGTGYDVMGLNILASAGGFEFFWAGFEVLAGSELLLAEETEFEVVLFKEVEDMEVFKGFKGPPSQNLGHGSALHQSRLTGADAVAASLCSANTDRTMPPDPFDLEVEPPDLTKGFFDFETEIGKALALANALSTFRFLFLSARVVTMTSTFDKVRLVRRARSMDSSFSGGGSSFGPCDCCCRTGGRSASSTLHWGGGRAKVNG